MGWKAESHCRLISQQAANCLQAWCRPSRNSADIETPPSVSAGCGSKDLIAPTYLLRHPGRKLRARCSPLHFLVLDLERFDGLGEVSRVPFHTNAVAHC